MGRKGEGGKGREGEGGKGVGPHPGKIVATGLLAPCFVERLVVGYSPNSTSPTSP